MLEFRHSSIFSRLRGLLEVTRLVRTEDDLPELLAAIARTVSESLGFHTVAVNLYRHEWDDYVVTTVHGSEAAREYLLGEVRQVDDWEPLLDARFLQRGAYVVPHGELDWAGLNAYTPDIPVSDDPGAWHPEDALFVPMRADDGRLLGVLSVDEPLSGRKPSGDEIDVLVAVADHAAIAVQAAQESTRAQRHRDALERLLEVSTRLTETWQTEELLQLVCTAISEALGFEKVAVQLLQPGSDLYDTAASHGFVPEEFTGVLLSAREIELLLQPQFEVAGCFVIPEEDARAILPDRPEGYRSRLNGAGARAWQNHWLLVPLEDRRGRRVGFIWADDPTDRLFPTPERLQLLRTFANQATTALTAAAHHTELEVSNQRRRSLIDASPVAIIDFDRDGHVRAWNQAAAAMFGWTAEEVVGRFNPSIPPEDHELFLTNLARIVEGETIRGLRVRRLRRDGSHIELEITAAPIRNGHGEVIGVVSLMADVGERERWEQAVRASDARKEAILRSALDSVITVDDIGRIVEFNPAAEEILGWTRAEAAGACFLTLAVDEEHRPEIAAAFESGRGPMIGSRHEITALRADRRPFPAEISINRVDVPGPALYAVSIRDVAKRKDREERLREAEARYRTLVEQIPLATYINETGFPIRTRYMSPQIEAMLGYPVSDWLRPDFYPTILHPADRDRIAAAAERTHRSGEPFQEEYRLVAADGRTVWVLDETIAVRDTEYRPLFLQGFLLDVTERRDADEALRRSEDVYRLVVESSNDLIALLDLDGTMKYVSPSIEQILGWTPEEAIGVPMAERVHPDDLQHVHNAFAELLGAEPTPRPHIRVRTKDGDWVRLAGTTSIIRGEDGEPTGFVTVSRPASAVDTVRPLYETKVA